MIDIAAAVAARINAATAATIAELGDDIEWVEARSRPAPKQPEDPEAGRGRRRHRFQLRDFLSRKLLARARELRATDPAEGTREFRAARGHARQALCGLLPVAELQGVDGVVRVVRPTEGGASSLRELGVCGSPWSCPACAARISERRRKELRGAVERHTETHGLGSVVNLTLTCRHKRWDELPELLKQLGAARRWFVAHRDYKTIVVGGTSTRRVTPCVAEGCPGEMHATRRHKGQHRCSTCRTIAGGPGEELKSVKVTTRHEGEMGCLGSVRALETTWSARNAWHPHLHVLLFLTRELSDEELKCFEDKLFPLWNDACLAVGLPSVSRQHGLKLTGGAAAADYIAKWGHQPNWGLAEEITKAHTKKAHGRDGATPWELLERAHQGDRHALQLYIHFAESFRGQRQLWWSHGLRDALGLDSELSDEQIAEGVGDVVEIATIPTARTIKSAPGRPVSQWDLVVRYRAQADVLDAADRDGAEGVRGVIDVLRERWRQVNRSVNPEPWSTA